MRKQRLELNWVNKDQQFKLEPRVLLTERIIGTPASSSDKSNLMIYGDNLLALKALESEFSGAIKAVVIDPPYNTGNAFEHYDDGIEHSIWLSLMKPRLEILRRLLSENGSIWIMIDDNEMHYLKVLCDEIFGRSNFVGSIIWQHSVQGKGYVGKFSLSHNYILVYRKSDKFTLGLLDRTEEHNKNYSNPDNDPRGLWRTGDVRNALDRPNLKYEISTPSGKKINPPEKGWRWSKQTVAEKIQKGEIIFSADESRIIKKIYLCEQEGRVPETLWLGSEVGTTREANKEIKNLFPDDLFSTPKPERLIKRILELSTSPNDWVLDSFLGSGTTVAVAHKMGRRWIGIECGEHCKSHCLPRLTKIVEGVEAGGITNDVKWTGGGSFHFMHLAPSLLTKDSHENWIISPKYNPVQLAEAICKHEGFKFWPDKNVYWKQGKSTENDFIFVTTEFLTTERIEKILGTMKPNETLLICAKAFRVQSDKYPSITIKKIPQILLGRCEFGCDDYSLNIQEFTQSAAEINQAQVGFTES